MMTMTVVDEDFQTAEMPKPPHKGWSSESKSAVLTELLLFWEQRLFLLQGDCFGTQCTWWLSTPAQPPAEQRQHGPNPPPPVWRFGLSSRCGFCSFVGVDVAALRSPLFPASLLALLPMIDSVSTQRPYQLLSYTSIYVRTVLVWAGCDDCSQCLLDAIMVAGDLGRLAARARVHLPSGGVITPELPFLRECELGMIPGTRLFCVCS
jgi:hypothetical protein